MVVGTTILKMGSGVFYSPQFSRGGLAAEFSLECTHEAGAANMTVDVEHRNSSDTAWAVVGTFGSITATGVYALNVTGIKEIVRVAYTLTGTDLTGFHVILGAPAWRPF